jgi:hypothetical protein
LQKPQKQHKKIENTHGQHSHGRHDGKNAGMKSRTNGQQAGKQVTEFVHVHLSPRINV